MARIEVMPPNALADYYYKAGVGLARFGNYRGARALLDSAVETARQHGLHEHDFQFSRVLQGLDACEAECGEEVTREEVVNHEAVREVAASLAGLVD